MLKRFAFILVAVVLTSVAAAASDAPDITGTWTATFDTQIGTQNYTYDFVVKDAVLTGKAKSNFGEATLSDGKVDNDKVTFVEMLKYQGNDIRIEYTGTIVSADEIKFTRKVADFATEDLVAKRSK